MNIKGGAPGRKYKFALHISDWEAMIQRFNLVACPALMITLLQGEVFGERIAKPALSGRFFVHCQQIPLARVFL